MVLASLSFFPGSMARAAFSAYKQAIGQGSSFRPGPLNLPSSRETAQGIPFSLARSFSRDMPGARSIPGKHCASEWSSRGRRHTATSPWSAFPCRRNVRERSRLSSAIRRPFRLGPSRPDPRPWCPPVPDVGQEGELVDKVPGTPMADAWRPRPICDIPHHLLDPTIGQDGWHLRRIAHQIPFHQGGEDRVPGQQPIEVRRLHALAQGLAVNNPFQRCTTSVPRSPGWSSKYLYGFWHGLPK